jgi:hypothetical protein
MDCFGYNGNSSNSNWHSSGLALEALVAGLHPYPAGRRQHINTPLPEPSIRLLVPMTQRRSRAGKQIAGEWLS